ncbi:hypothetical protein MKX03_009738 [Papaver bracteatum]|nr:hypothetical protein MKX03_009738 [Papaver bracteatum]
MQPWQLHSILEIQGFFCKVLLPRALLMLKLFHQVICTFGKFSIRFSCVTCYMLFFRLEKIKNDKLQSPDFHISRTRLAVYDFPMTISEKQLKNLMLDAVVSADSKQTLVIQQDAKASNKQLKRGTAFVEFSEHQHALAALKAYNNNPKPFGPEHRPIVEFAVENIQSLKRLREKLERWQARACTEFLPPPATSLRESS